MMGEPHDDGGLRAYQDRWEADTLAPNLERFPESRESFTTISGRPIERVYTPLDYGGDGV